MQAVGLITYRYADYMPTLSDYMQAVGLIIYRYADYMPTLSDYMQAVGLITYRYADYAVIGRLRRKRSFVSKYVRLQIYVGDIADDNPFAHQNVGADGEIFGARGHDDTNVRNHV